MTTKQKEAVHALVYQSHAIFEDLLRKKGGEWSDEFDKTFLEHRQAMFKSLESEFPNRTAEENDAMWTALKAGFARIKKTMTGE